jgi:hypothetical protein
MISMKLAPSLLVLVVASVSLETAAASGAAAAVAQGYTTLPSKKSGAGVDISYRIEGTPAPGSPVIIHLTTSSQTDAQITLRGGEGLVVSSANGVLTSLAGQVTQHRIEVTPQAQGRLYLYVESSANGRGSSNAIAVQVGKTEVQRKPSGNVQSMPDGERVISVPAK